MPPASATGIHAWAINPLVRPWMARCCWTALGATRSESHDCYLSVFCSGGRRAIPSTWRSPITWAGGGNIPPNRPADDATLAPAGPRDSPWGGRRGWRVRSLPTQPAALVRSGYPGDLPSGERPFLIFKLIPCHARAARRARGAGGGSERIAGCSGGASGPCRPGLKTYKKVLTDWSQTWSQTCGLVCVWSGCFVPGCA
jgi:hypothetical protein